MLDFIKRLFQPTITIRVCDVNPASDRMDILINATEKTRERNSIHYINQTKDIYEIMLNNKIYLFSYSLSETVEDHYSAHLLRFSAPSDKLRTIKLNRVKS